MAIQNMQQAARQFAGAFAATFAEALSRSAGRAWELKVADAPDPSARRGKAIHFRVALEGALRGALYVELYEQQVKELVSKISDKPLAAFDEEHGNALEEVISAAGTALAAALEARHGALSCSVKMVSEPALSSLLIVPLSSFEEDQPGPSIALYFDAQLMAALAPEAAAQGAARPKPAAAAVDGLNLSLVMDVELNVWRRFGQRQVPLHQVLELVSGSVIELDRQVDDPVELLLDGKVIARGEAVIVDGNYGLRVTEVPQPMATHLMR